MCLSQEWVGKADVDARKQEDCKADGKKAGSACRNGRSGDLVCAAAGLAALA